MGMDVVQQTNLALQIANAIRAYYTLPPMEKLPEVGILPDSMEIVLALRQSLVNPDTKFIVIPRKELEDLQRDAQQLLSGDDYKGFAYDVQCMLASYL